MIINLMQILPCQLSCNFCAKTKVTLTQERYSLEKFITIVNICTKYGIDSFDLTPHIGDFLLDKQHMSKILFLESNPKVKKWNFVTNFLTPSPEFCILIPEFSKGTISPSIYGLTDKQYFETTGKHMFSKLCDNLWFTIIKAKDNKKKLKNINIYVRYNSSPINRESSYMLFLLDEMKKLGAREDISEICNKNWGGLIESDFERKKNGICQHAIQDNGIFLNGDMTLCNCWDTYKTLNLGNIFDESLESIYSENSKFGELIKGQMFGKYTGICEKCNDFELINIDKIEIDWLKKYINIIEKTRKQR